MTQHFHTEDHSTYDTAEANNALLDPGFDEFWADTTAYFADVDCAMDIIVPRGFAQ